MTKFVLTLNLKVGKISRPKENVISLFKREVNLKLSHQNLVNPNDCLPSHYHVSLSTNQSKVQNTLKSFSEH